ncbi:NAD-dependent dehydratase [Sulfolobales archaeon HS-7]|nr:NAD-dependent dehydratase [Sulfolobales archaeon HS-7]
MKVIVLGADGYLGWPLALRLSARGHEVVGVDNLFTRTTVENSGSSSAIPIPPPESRIEAARNIHGFDIKFIKEDITKPGFLRELIEKEKPDAVVDFAEQRSAPYSMKGENEKVHTIVNNLVGTIRLIEAVKSVDPSIHILKMGTMGEYGTPNFDIPESPFVQAIIGGKQDRIITPKKAGSIYHYSKVFDTYIFLFENEVSNITATDIMQGPVYGTRTSEIIHESLHTRFDFDETWGTVVNRFCVEAVIGTPLTPYGKGGQTRGFLSLEDSMEALTLLLENPPKPGEYRVANQFTEIYSIRQIADMVKNAAEALGLKVSIQQVENPRIEAEQHYYNPEIKLLPSLGFKPKRRMEDELKSMIKDLLPYKERISQYSHVILPKTKWRTKR